MVEVTREYYDWTPDSLLEVILPEPENFLKIKETLTRIGVCSLKDQTIWQSCHILHKRGSYYIVHFLELFCLDGKVSTITAHDIERRNAIASLLEQWGLLTIKESAKSYPRASIHEIKIVPYDEKPYWNLKAKYTIGIKQKKSGNT